jgi:hypothetical protein
MLLGDNNSKVSETKVYNSGFRAESITVDKGFLDSLETAIYSITPAPPNSNV